MTLLAAAIALLVVAGIGRLTALAFHHDHSRGHCGWSGCQAKETR